MSADPRTSYDGGDAATPVEALPERVGASAWVVQGVASGVIGAFLVALLFLGFDAVQARAFWTPHALGSALFLGEAPAADPSAVIVLGYTFVHGAVFVSLGLLAAVLVPLISGTSSFVRRVALFVALFVGLQVVFGLFEMLFAGAVGVDLKPWTVAIANCVAALAMAGYLNAASRSLEEARDV